jgi:hypothetical protein
MGNEWDGAHQESRTENANSQQFTSHGFPSGVRFNFKNLGLIIEACSSYVKPAFTSSNLLSFFWGELRAE